MEKEVYIICGVLAFVLTVFILSVVVFNRQHRATIKTFRQIADERNAKIFRGKEIRFWRTRGMRTQISPWTVADLYWFGDALVIIRQQHFILRIDHPPIAIIAGDRRRIAPSLAFETHRPSSVRFARHCQGVLEIKLTDRVKEYGSIDITIKGLSREESTDLMLMEGWVNRG